MLAHTSAIRTAAPRTNSKTRQIPCARKDPEIHAFLFRTALDDNKSCGNARDGRRAWFCCGYLYFIASFFGLTLDKLGAGMILLHLGIFALALPLAAIEGWSNRKTIWGGRPRWVVRSTQILALLFFVIFFAFLAMSHVASPEIINGEYVLNNHGKIVGYISEKDYLLLKGWELRLFASGWMFFYYSLTTKWWFPRREETPWTVIMPD
jgi:hypothetical protein